MPSASSSVQVLKPANSVTNYTEQEFRDLLACAGDPLYFMRTFMKVQHPTRGSLPFNPYPYQERLVLAFNTHRFNITLAGRQLGKTTVAGGFLLWRAMFVPDSTILITANNYAQALEIMDRIRYAYENVPDHIRAGVREYNKGSVVFDNGSRIVARATTPNAGRGLSISLLYVDEFAAIHTNIAKNFFTAIYPTLSAGGSCIITSTPQSSEDSFATTWKGAIDNTDEYGNLLPSGVGKNGFFATLIPWFEHPDRDEAWAEEQRATLGPAKFAQEHECQFVTDDDTLINPLKLSRMRHKDPEFYTGTIRWYGEPEANKSFLVALDPSLGMNADAAAIEVFQMPEMIQVAEWQHNGTSPRRQVAVLMEVLVALDSILREHADQHSDPEIFWTFENNSIGEAILQIVEDTGEERFPGMLVTEPRRKGISMKRVRKGLNTSPKSRLSSLARMKSLIESDRMIIHSRNLIKELKTFVSSGATFRAKPGDHDDLVMALSLICRLLDVALRWGTRSGDGDLKETIDDEEFSLSMEPMPVLM